MFNKDVEFPGSRWQRRQIEGELVNSCKIWVSAPRQLGPLPWNSLSEAAWGFCFYLSCEMAVVVSPAVERFSVEWVSGLFWLLPEELWDSPRAVGPCIELFKDNGLWIHVRAHWAGCLFAFLCFASDFHSFSVISQQWGIFWCGQNTRGSRDTQ